MKETKAKIEFDKHGNRRVLNYNGVWANHVDSDGKILHVDIDGFLTVKLLSDQF